MAVAPIPFFFLWAWLWSLFDDLRLGWGAGWLWRILQADMQGAFERGFLYKEILI